MKVDSLETKIYDTRLAMGKAAAEDIKACLLSLLAEKESVSVIFAAAPSQNEVLATLSEDPEIPWERIHAYHMDEYIGLSADAPQGFGNFLKAHLFGLVPLGQVSYIDSTAKDPEEEARRYACLLAKDPADLVVMGIGENGHIAFNDPPVADFGDPLPVKPVALDETCRMQQVHDGCFASLKEVPTHAITLTVPTLIKAPRLFCIVPGPTKAKAVKATLEGEISTRCPASILRTHPCAILYLDRESAGEFSR